MDYWIAFYEGKEVVASYIVEDCPSEVVALSEAMGRLEEDNGSAKWVLSVNHRIMICLLDPEEEDNERSE